MFKDRKNITILVLSVIILILIISIFIFFIANNKQNNITNSESTSYKLGKDNEAKAENLSELSYPDLRYFLEKKGYTFETQTITSDSFNCTYFSNEEIAISATIDIEGYKYILEYWDKTFEGPACCITDLSANTTENKQKQYTSYLKWKENIGLTQEQIKEVLLKYYLENN